MTRHGNSQVWFKCLGVKKAVLHRIHGQPVLHGESRTQKKKQKKNVKVVWKKKEIKNKEKTFLVYS